LIQERQFDTIYHEHFSYFSLLVADRILGASRPGGFRRRGIANAWRVVAGLCRARRGEGAAQRTGWRGDRGRTSGGARPADSYGISGNARD